MLNFVPPPPTAPLLPLVEENSWRHLWMDLSKMEYAHHIQSYFSLSLSLSLPSVLLCVYAYVCVIVFSILALTHT